MSKAYAVLTVATGDAPKLVGIRTDRTAALELWDLTRRRLRKKVKKQIEEWEAANPEMENLTLTRCLANLKNSDPKTCDNYPYATPILKSTEDFE